MVMRTPWYKKARLIQPKQSGMAATKRKREKTFWSSADESVISALADEFRNGCVLLVGAGVSGHQFPLAIDVKKLMAKTLIENAVGVTKKDIQTFLDSSPWDKVTLETFLAWVNSILGKEAATRIIQVFKGGEPGHYHHFVASCVKRGFPLRVFTTNFDELLEAAYSRNDIELEVLTSSSSFNQGQDAPTIVKIHGTVSNTDSILVTLNDIYESRGSHALSDLKRCIESEALVVFGYSGSDLLDVMPQILASDVHRMIWIMHVPDRSTITKELAKLPAATIRYLNLLSQRKNAKIIAGDTTGIFKRLGKKLNILPAAAEAGRPDRLELSDFCSAIQSRSVQIWELVDLFGVMNSTPAHRIMEYLRANDLFIDEPYEGGVLGWRAAYALTKDQVTRHIAEAYRSCGNVLLRHGEVDPNYRFAETSLSKAQEMLLFLGDPAAASEVQLKRIELHAMRSEMYSFENLESHIRRERLERLKIETLLKKAEFSLRNSNPVAVFEMLAGCKDEVFSLGNVELLTCYCGLIVATMIHIQTIPDAITDFHRFLRWELWQEHIVLCAHEYLKNLASGVSRPSFFNHKLMLAAIARLLHNFFDPTADAVLWSNDDFYLSGCQAEIDKFLIACRKQPSKHRFDDLVNHAREKYPFRCLSEQGVENILRRIELYHESWNPAGRKALHDYEPVYHGGEKLVIDHATGLVWQQSGSRETTDYISAEANVSKLNEELFAGYNDWRIPLLEEAMPLIESPDARELIRRMERSSSQSGYKGANEQKLYINQVFDTEQSKIWTSDRFGVTNAGDIYIIHAWAVSFEKNNFDVESFAYLRAVRDLK